MKLCEKCCSCTKNNFCTNCNLPTDQIELGVTVIDKSVKVEQKDIEDDQWIGPIDRACFKCSKKQIHFMVSNPPSADEPPIVRYKCFNCHNLVTQYKN